MTKIYKTGHPNFIIRIADELDIPLIFHFIKSLAKYEKMLDLVIATEQSLHKSLFIDKQAEVLIAVENEKPIGFALFYQSFSTFQGKANLFLEDLFIEEPYRNKGYGKLILSCLALIAKERNYSRIDWWCLDWNQKSIDFYESLGAVQLKQWEVFRLQDQKIFDLSKLIEIYNV